MKIKIGQLQEIIRKTIAGSVPDESYSSNLLDDPAFLKKSVYVPDDIKDEIVAWAKKMKLDS
jgi:hypothetical protein